jgi:hypothetical protein
MAQNEPSYAVQPARTSLSAEELRILLAATILKAGGALAVSPEDMHAVKGAQLVLEPGAQGDGVCAILRVVLPDAAPVAGSANALDC